MVMKLPMLFICMVCVTSAMAERPAIRAPAVVATDVATTDIAQSPRKTCEPTQSFNPIQASEFEDIAGYGTNMSFPSDREEWLPGVEGAFSCTDQEQAVRWQAPGAQALEAMRLLPSYPSSNNPSVLSSGWRKFKAE